MHACGATHDRIYLGIGELLLVNLGFETYIALLSIWEWVEVRGFRDC